MAKEDERQPKEKKERRKKSKSAVAEVLDSAEAGGQRPPTKSTTSSSKFPIPRKVLLDPQQFRRYTSQNKVAFVNGNDRRHTDMNVEWGNTHPDLGRPFDPNAEPGTVLPNTWPPNMELKNAQYSTSEWYPPPTHGGLSWPGAPKPRIFPTRRELINRLPGFMQRFLLDD